MSRLIRIGKIDLTCFSVDTNFAVGIVDSMYNCVGGCNDIIAWFSRRFQISIRIKVQIRSDLCLRKQLQISNHVCLFLLEVSNVARYFRESEI